MDFSFDTNSNMRTLVDVAYRRLKSHVYNETGNLALRVEIAEFEADEEFETKLDILSQVLTTIKNNPESENDSFNQLLNKISSEILPKRFLIKTNNENKNSFYYSNDTEQNRIPVDKVIHFITCPIEIHIVSVLWIMKIGCKLDSKLDQCAFANRLVKDQNDFFQEFGLKLFEPYYFAYKDWRDRALSLTRKVHDSKLDVGIVSLDIKNYFDSVNLDLLKIEIPSEADQDFNFLNNLLNKVHKKYKEKRGASSDLLPIGLLSSMILANHCLVDFDESIQNELRPAYYGRYVDDILLVFINPPKTDEPTQFLKKTFAPSSSLELDSKSSCWKLNSKTGNFFIQPEKIKVFFFAKDKSISLLDEFEKKIRSTSSEFRLLMEDSTLMEKFTSEAIKISYSDSFNKIRSVDSFTADRWGASVYLANLLDATKSTSPLTNDEFLRIEKSIYDFFTDPTGLENYVLWEKIFTLFVINRRKTALVRFSKSLIKNIARISSSNIETSQELKTSLIIHLGNCFAMAAALDLKFFRDELFQDLKEKVVTDPTVQGKISRVFDLLTKSVVSERANALVKSNLFRHRYCFYPLLNYCIQKDDFSFSSPKAIHKANFDWSDTKLRWSPRFIHFHEFALFHALRKNLSVQMKSMAKSNAIDPVATDIEQAKVDFIEFNHLRQKSPKLAECLPDKIGIYLNVKGSGASIDKFKIGIANVMMPKENTVNSLLGHPNLSLSRLVDLNQILNSAVSNKVDMLIFPENYLPYPWLDHLTKFSKRNRIAIITGLEHIKSRDNFALNLAAVLLPFDIDEYTNVYVDLRIKSYYSPNEIDTIAGLKLKIPKVKDQNIILSWRDSYFSVFNCFELAKIKKRAKLVGKVDFVVAIENNSDTEYFSNLVESTARDLHSYFVQVNNSCYGDSRITQPTKSFEKDLIRIKGGINSSLHVDNINIEALRISQYSLGLNKVLNHNDAQRFKHVPPGFLLPKKRYPRNLK